MTSSPGPARRAEARRTPDPWPIAARTVCWGTVASGVAFALLDPRPVPDLNRAHEMLPAIQRWLDAPDAPVRGLSSLLLHGGAFYDLLLALLLRAPLPGRPTCALVGVGWLALLLVATGRLARAVAGAWRRVSPAAAETAAVALVASTPLVVGATRLGWVHLPEAALLCTLVAAWAGDRALTRPGAVAVVAGAGAFALGLRPSALPWLVAVAGALVLGFPAGGDRRRVAAALLPWGFGLPGTVLDLPDYLAEKLAARPRYLAQVADLADQVRAEVGLVPLLLALAGAALALPVLRRAGRALPTLLLVLVGLGGVLAAGSGAGIDNFTVAWPALCVLAGAGLGRFRLAAALPVLPWALLTLSSWLPAELARRVLVVLPGSPPGYADDHPGNPLRVYPAFGEPQVRALLDATCPDRGLGPGGCRVAVDHGLFRATAEEPGRFELAVMGEHRVTLVDLARGGDGAAPSLGVDDGPVDALARFRCRAEEPAWRRRHPGAAARARAVIDAQQLALAWAIDLDHHCRFEWWTPGAMLAVPLGDGPGAP
ncbi:MAG: hypothetical protein D6798_04930 [Deltaproteobacteria bacterium]|nr:MAG: hypothetical protein D6798_04930 [Deltaproteobacteria bacterium]